MAEETKLDDAILASLSMEEGWGLGTSRGGQVGREGVLP